MIIIIKNSPSQDEAEAWLDSVVSGEIELEYSGLDDDEEDY